jgi:DNA-directed RNA polymerase subunit RPC12/RpoP
MPEVMLRGYRCERCGHEWIPRSTTEGKPTICPKCKSPYWDKPRKMVAIATEQADESAEMKSLSRKYKKK